MPTFTGGGATAGGASAAATAGRRSGPAQRGQRSGGRSVAGSVATSAWQCRQLMNMPLFNHAGVVRGGRSPADAVDADPVPFPGHGQRVEPGIEARKQRILLAIQNA